MKSSRRLARSDLFRFIVQIEFVNKKILLFSNALGKTTSEFVFVPARGLVTSRFLTTKL